MKLFSRPLIGALCVALLPSTFVLAGSSSLSPPRNFNTDPAFSTPASNTMFSGPTLPDTFHGKGEALVAQEARNRLGNQWVATALRITHIESGGRCNAIGPRTRHGHAKGLMQVLPGSAESLEPGSSRHLTECETGARIGILHMVRCLSLGATTPQLMALCHVSGGIAQHLNKKATHYAWQYQRLFAGLR